MTQDKILATRTAEHRMQPSCSEQDHSSGPTCGFVAFPEVGPGASIGTPQPGYPLLL